MASRQVTRGKGMMVVNMDLQSGIFQALLETADSSGLPGIDQNKFGHLVQGNISEPMEIIKILHRLDKKIPEVFLLGAGEGQDGAGVKFFGGNHGGKAVKIRIEMGGDYFHDLQAPGR
jgi:hypothetical protein